MILDKRKSLEDGEGTRTTGNGSGFNLPQSPGEKNSAEYVSVYFYVKDKLGNYDQELTMSFYEFWNESQNGTSGKNESMFQGVFYQRVSRFHWSCHSFAIMNMSWYLQSHILCFVVCILN